MVNSKPGEFKKIDPDKSGISCGKGLIIVVGIMSFFIATSLVFSIPTFILMMTESKTSSTTTNKTY
jgi:hypothetical protein